MSVPGELRKLQSFYRRGAWPQVIQVGEQLRHQGRDDHVLNAWLAMAYHVTKQDQKAIPLCEKLYQTATFSDVQTECREIGISAMRYHVVLARHFFQEKRYDEALRICERLKVFDNKLSDKFIIAGKVYLEQGHYSRAAEEFARLLTERPDRADNAVACLRYLLDAEPSNEAAHRALFDLSERTGTTRKQISDNEARLARSPDEARAIFALGYLYTFSGSAPQALALWQRYLAKYPTWKHLHLARGHAHFHQDDYAQAENCWQQFEPATIAEAEALLQCYNRLFSRSWSSEPVLWRLVELGVKWDRLDVVEGPLKIMRKIKPDSPMIGQILEQVLVLQVDRHTKAGSSTAALARLKELVRLHPDKPAYQQRLAEFLAAHPGLQAQKDEVREAPAPSEPAHGATLVGDLTTPAGGLHSATEAIVVVDLCDSTTLASKFGDRYLLEVKKLLADTAEPLFKQHQVRWLKSTGDGYLSIFPNSREAALAAVTLLRTFQEEKQLAESHPIHIRIGIHFGETQVDGNGERHGQVVHKAFRIEGVKPSDLTQVEGSAPRAEVPLRNRIFLSEEVYDDIYQDDIPRCRFIGVTELKGFSGLHRLYELKWQEQPRKLQPAAGESDLEHRGTGPRV
ncbi:MAG: tetratricopeptide repeat protein [Candidatus Tectomicrobia bacterium]|nr:tetratricopeptide repeat protein [Candidatus Tectomicrobia bacterium]